MQEENKIYVGNLEFSLTEDELKNAIEEKGVTTKAVKIIKDKYTGKAKGFGFVEVNSVEDVDKAIEVLDGQDLKGRKLKVSKAKAPRPRSDRGDKGDRMGRSGYNRQAY